MNPDLKDYINDYISAHQVKTEDDVKKMMSRLNIQEDLNKIMLYIKITRQQF